MRLVYIANARLPTGKAYGIQIMKMCEAFAERGIEVELVIPWHWNEMGLDPFEYYNIKKIFRLIKMPGLDFIHWGAGKIGFFLASFIFLLSVRLYLFFKKYDLVYTREQLGGLFFIGFILELHTLPLEIGVFYRYLFSKPNSLVVLTTFMKIRLMEAGFSEDRIIVAPDGVDLREFDINISKEEARQRLSLPLDKRVVLYTGSFYFYDWKGIDILLEASRSFRDDCFVLVGAHTEAEVVRVKENYPFPNILASTYVNRRLIPYYLKSADVLVIPNRRGNHMSEFYTSPLKLFEYMASKRPIISSNLPSLREILSGREAVFFEPNDAGDLVRVMSDLFAKPELQKELSANAYYKVKNYTWDKRVAHILEAVFED